MTTIYGDYSNLRDTREIYLDSAQIGDDTLLLSMIQQASVDIDSISHRRFYPVLETRKFDAPYYSYDLQLNDEILDVDSVINGNGDSLTVSDLVLVPYNTLTHRVIRLLPTISTWINGPSGFPYAAISVTGTWVHAADYTTGWMSIDTLDAGLLVGAASFTASPGVFFAGMILKIDSEFMYVSSVTVAVPPGTTVDTVYITRGINGSVAAGHLITTAVYKWNPGRDITLLAASAAVAYYHLKSNPSGNSYTLDGVTFETPKDVTEFIRTRLVQLNLIRLGVG
jgi:hypothetical protein